MLRATAVESFWQMGKDMHGMDSPSMHASFIFGDLGSRRGGNRGGWPASQGVHEGTLGKDGGGWGIEDGSMRRAGWKRHGR